MIDVPNGGAVKDMIIASRAEREEPDGFRDMYVAGFLVVARAVPSSSRIGGSPRRSPGVAAHTTYRWHLEGDALRHDFVETTEHAAACGVHHRDVQPDRLSQSSATNCSALAKAGRGFQKRDVRRSADYSCSRVSSKQLSTARSRWWPHGY